MTGLVYDALKNATKCFKNETPVKESPTTAITTFITTETSFASSSRSLSGFVKRTVQNVKDSTE